MSFLASVHARAAARRRRIVFPESDDPRTLAAVRALAAAGIVEPVLVGHASTVSDACDVVDCAGSGLADDVAADLMRLRAEKGLTEAEAARLATLPLVVADALVRWGRADGCVAGAVHTTGEVIRTALWLVGAADDVQTVSSAFYMVLQRRRDSGEGDDVLTFTDCAVVRYPTASQLADIALAAARARRRIVGDIPRV
ncbi:MAG: phosphate acyltransferase, partial [Gemmatimonadaceae bacterium]